MTISELPVVRIIDDNDVMRESLVFLLEEEDGWIVKAYRDAEEFLDNDDFEQAGCILLDIRMPKMSGLEFQQYLINISIDIPIVFLSGHADVAMAIHALKRGALDLLQKPVDDEVLIAALHSAVEKDIKRRNEEAKIESLEQKYALLTQREKEVVMLAAQGLMNKVIADKLGISERTAQTHRGVACRKLNAKTSVDLLRVLQTLGLESTGLDDTKTISQ